MKSKIPLPLIKNFIKDVESGKIKTSDTKIVSRIRKLYSKESLTEKQQIIKKLKDSGIGDEDIPWELESLETLKKLYKTITKN